jgi:hypothetical protein
MKTKGYYLSLGIVIAILYVPALGQTESSLPEYRQPILIGRPHPELAGIDKLHVAILPSGAEPNKDGLIWTELEAKVINKFNKAGIKLAPGIAGSILNISELRVYINMLKLEDSQQYVFAIQTSLSRAVCLIKERSPVFKADVWKIKPVMQAISVQNMPTAVTKQVLEQVETFIQAYKAANPPGKGPSDTRTSKTDSLTAAEKQTKPVDKSAVAEYQYVASKNSKIFHKPECRWAKRIKPENLVGYNSKEEVSKAGKRPCKVCKP